MRFAELMLALPAVLAVHHLDEVRGADSFVTLYKRVLGARFGDPRVFKMALILIPIATVVLVVSNAMRGGAELRLLCEVAVFAMLVNAIGHGGQSLARRTLLPGTVSGLVVIMPFCVVAVAVMRAEFGAAAGSLLLYAVLGLFAIPLVVAVSLVAGYGLTRGWDSISRRRP